MKSVRSWLIISVLSMRKLQNIFYGKKLRKKLFYFESCRRICRHLGQMRGNTLQIFSRFVTDGVRKSPRTEIFKIATIRSTQFKVMTLAEFSDQLWQLRRAAESVAEGAWKEGVEFTSSFVSEIRWVASSVRGLPSAYLFHLLQLSLIDVGNAIRAYCYSTASYPWIF